MFEIWLGFQVPEIPFGEIKFKFGTVSPLQIASDVGKSGTIELFTVTLKVTGDAHCPTFGVNV